MEAAAGVAEAVHARGELPEVLRGLGDDLVVELEHDASFRFFGVGDFDVKLRSRRSSGYGFSVSIFRGNEDKHGAGRTYTFDLGRNGRYFIYYDSTGRAGSLHIDTGGDEQTGVKMSFS